MHAQANSGKLATEPHGIALAGGCCGGGYAKDGIYPFTGETEPGETGLPYIELLHCQKL